MNLHNDATAFQDILTSAAAASNFLPAFVVKDYWLTTVLRELAQSPHQAMTVFKGGTSLSKAYGIIQRFSEDVDLALIVENLSGNQVKSRMDAISKGITKHLPEVNIVDVTSKGSRFRRTAHDFPRLTETLVFPGQARAQLVLEINAFANPFPFQEVEITSIIGAHLRELGREDILQQFNLQPFHLQVLKPTRTLAEKVLALARASYAEDPIAQLQEKIRHTYDLYWLLQQPELLAFVAGDGFLQTLRLVQADDAKNKEFQGDWASLPLAAAKIYQDDDALWGELEPVYSGAFKVLVYGPLPTLAEIRQALRQLAERLKAFDESSPVNS